LSLIGNARFEPICVAPLLPVGGVVRARGDNFLSERRVPRLVVCVPDDDAGMVPIVPHSFGVFANHLIGIKMHLILGTVPVVARPDKILVLDQQASFVGDTALPLMECRGADRLPKIREPGSDNSAIRIKESNGSSITGRNSCPPASTPIACGRSGVLRPHRRRRSHSEHYCVSTGRGTLGAFACPYGAPDDLFFR
jgi:hypothetical protein